MSLLEGLEAGLRMRQYLDSREDEAAKRQATVKLLKAQADGQAASAALHRNQLEQAIAHQGRLAQAFLLQGQGPDPLPGDEPGAVPPAPQSRLRQEFFSGAVPPASMYESAQPGIPPPSEQEPQGIQPRQQRDEQGQLLDFARRYNPSQPQGKTVTPIAPTLTTPAAPSVPSGATTPLAGTAEPSAPATRATDLLRAPGGSPAAVPLPAGVGASSTPLQMPATSVTATGPDDTLLLRNLSKAHFLNSQPREALTIYQYAAEQRRLRDVGRLYREVLSDTSASEPQRRIALAGLGQALIRASQVDEGMKLLTSQLPLSSRQVLAQASVDTRNVLLEQAQAGQPLDVAAANKEAEARAIRRTNATREPATQIVETEAGIWSVDKRTGIATPVTTPETPGRGPSPTPTGKAQPLPGKRMTEG